MTITSDKPDLGDVREELEAEYEPEPLAIGFNRKCGSIALRRRSPPSAGLARAEHESGGAPILFGRRPPARRCVMTAPGPGNYDDLRAPVDIGRVHTLVGSAQRGMHFDGVEAAAARNLRIVLACERMRTHALSCAHQRWQSRRS